MQKETSMIRISKNTRDILKRISEKRQIPMSIVVQLLAEKEEKELNNN